MFVFCHKSLQYGKVFLSAAEPPWTLSTITLLAKIRLENELQGPFFATPIYIFVYENLSNLYLRIVACTVHRVYIHYIFTIVHYMFTICSLYVHYMFAIYSLCIHHIFTMFHYMFTECSLNVHYILTISSLDLHYMFTIYSLYVHYIFTRCSLYIHCMFTIYSLDVHRMTLTKCEYLLAVAISCRTKKCEHN